MKESNSIIQNILASEKKSLVKKSFQTLLFIGIVLTCFYLVERGMISLDKVKVIAVSDPFPNYPWTMQSSLNPELKEKIKAEFYELDDPEITIPLKADGFLPVTDADYDIVRDTRILLGMD